MKYALAAILIALMFFPTLTIAQDDGCKTVVEEAITTAATHCAELKPNEVCLGHPNIDKVIQNDPDLSFDTPGDTLSLDCLCSMHLSPLQTTGSWGLAMMQVSPSEDDQPIRYVLFGDVEIQNAASARSELTAQVVSATEVHSGPGSHYGVIETLPAGRIIDVNGCNCTGNWLRLVLEDGRVGWIWAGSVTGLGDDAELPMVRSDTPVYASMQAFTFRSGDVPTCSSAPEDGILIQARSELNEAQLQINGAEVTLDATVFVQSQPGKSLTIEVLEGAATITATGFAATVRAGARAVIPMTENNTPTGLMRIEPFASQDVANLPVTLLPETVNPVGSLDGEIPYIAGVENCQVVSGRGETICPLHFVNPDGDLITQMTVEFVDAPEGEWKGSVHNSPELMDGDTRSGRLAWNVSCSLGNACFIGPVRWSITLTDQAGHVSDPFEASFNCVSVE